MAVLASSILSRVRAQLIDTGSAPRWTDAELLRWLSDGQRTIAALQPDVAAKVAVVMLEAGTRQRIPTDGRQLLTVIRNMGADGQTPGRSVRIIMREIIDAQMWDWHQAPKQQVAVNYIYDPQDQKAFFVYPPNNGSGSVEINYQFIPPEITAADQAITLDDIFSVPLTDYVLFRAHQKDADSSGGLASAQLFLQAFTLFVTGTETGDIDSNANQQLTPFDSSKKATAK
jgi:hypothetical protein